MDSARIGTIHSLCSEILRAHPAEAGIDPKFDVIDEGLAAVLRVQLVEDALAVLVERPEFAPLFNILGIKPLTDLLAFLLDHRLEAHEIFEKNIDSTQVICQVLHTSLYDPAMLNCIEELRSMRGPGLLQDAGDKLAIQVQDLLALWSEAH
jgi:ATP-dependent helicase/nuclease subunit A